jgi:hypothetical protein
MTAGSASGTMCRSALGTTGYWRPCLVKSCFLQSTNLTTRFYLQNPWSFEALWSFTIFWDITPCKPLKVNRRFGGAELRLSPDFTLVSCSAYSSILKMEAICSSETSIAFQRTTRRHIPEDDSLHDHRCENLKSDMFYFPLLPPSCESLPITSYRDEWFSGYILFLFIS